MIPSPVATYAAKVAITTVMVVLIAEVGRRNTLAASIIASLPVTSLLAILWLYRDTKDTAQIAGLATGIFWLVLPSLILFVTLPWLLNRQIPFYPALGISCALTVTGYFAMLKLLAALNIQAG